MTKMAEQSDGVTELEKRIAKFENLLSEMRAETTEAHSVLKETRKERERIEKLLAGKEIRHMINSRVDEIVKGELDKIGPEIRRQSSLIYDKVGHQIDRLIDIALGKEFSVNHNREDLRPILGAKLRQWIDEIIREEGL